MDGWVGIVALYQEIRVNFHYGVYFTKDVIVLYNP